MKEHKLVDSYHNIQVLYAVLEMMIMQSSKMRHPIPHPPHMSPSQLTLYQIHDVFLTHGLGWKQFWGAEPNGPVMCFGTFQLSYFFIQDRLIHQRTEKWSNTTTDLQSLVNNSFIKSSLMSDICFCPYFLLTKIS